MKLVSILSVISYIEALRNKNKCKKYKPECVPVCKSDCSSSSDSSSSESSIRDCRLRGNTDQHIQLIQGVLLQVNLNIEKYARWYTEELKNGLIAGITLIDKRTIEKLLHDFDTLEQRIIKLSEHYNDEIFRELNDLIGNTNSELQKSVLKLLKISNAQINSDLTDASPLGPPPAPIAANTVNTDIINKGFKDLLDELEQLFSRVTTLELSAANKIVEDKLQNQLKAFEKILTEFNKKVESYFRDLSQETLALVALTVNNSTRRFVGNIEELNKKVGYNIISVLRECNVPFTPPVLMNRSYNNEENYRTPLNC
ncbi:hypothetical protein P3W45_001323 [Vairimorpha bombi]